MKALKEYNIKFIGLKEGTHDYEFEINRAFFEHFDYEDFNDIKVQLKVTLVKKTTLLEFHLDAQGEVQVNCDVTNEPYAQPISATFDLLVKFGQEFNDEIEDVLIIPHGEYEVDISQYVYETIVLALPQKRIHPGVEDGTLESDILDKLEELSVRGPKDKSQEQEEESTDPRWDALKKLLTDK